VRGDRAARWRAGLARLAVGTFAQAGYRWRRPRHTLTGRQDAQAVARSGVRLKLLRQQAEAGDIDLLYLDESEALTHPYLACCWALRGADLRIQAPGQSRRRALLGAWNPVDGRLLVNTSATKRSTDFIALLDRIGEVYGTTGRTRPLVIVLDNGPIHTSKITARALAERPWLTVEWLPKYAPELNDIERRWRDLKQNHLANRTFADAEDLDRTVHVAVENLNEERKILPSAGLAKAA
jgi:hypothetical protein